MKINDLRIDKIPKKRPQLLGGLFRKNYCH